jgi:hypothetical protein
MTASIWAITVSNRLGEHVDAIVTGVTPKDTFVRVLTIAEGEKKSQDVKLAGGGSARGTPSIVEG